MSYIPSFAGIIFDLDGTLLDSMGLWSDVDRDFLAQFGYSVPPDLMEKVTVMNFREGAAYFRRRFTLPLSEDEIIFCWEKQAQEAYAHRVTAKPFVKEFLTLQKNLGVSMCIATSCHRDMAESALDRLELAPFFQFLLTSQEMGKGKDSPDIFLQCAQRLGLSPKECLVVEDSMKAGMVAQNAGFPVLAVYEPLYKEKWNLFSNFADYSIDGFGQLL